jgi:hypothetical protein
MANGALPGILALTFSETIKADTVKPEQFKLQSTVNNDANSFALDATSSVSSTNAAVVSITLTSGDITTMRASNPNLAVAEGSTFITMGELAAFDMAAERVEAIVKGSAKKVANYAADMTAPVLNSYTLNLNTGILSLVFSEAIKVSGFAVGGLTLQDTANVASASKTLNLANSAVQSGQSGYVSTLLIEIDGTELDTLKADAKLAKSAAQTYLEVDIITDDKASFAVNPILSSAGLKAGDVFADTTGPVLEKFALDMNALTLSLTFDEVVTLADYSASSSIKVQSVANAGNGVAHLLETSTAKASGQAATSRILILDIGVNDANAIKETATLGTKKTDSFLSFTSALIKDIKGNAILQNQKLRNGSST